jgi:Secretion system C-terminal sorting domain
MKKISFSLLFFLMLCLSKQMNAQTTAIMSDDFVQRIGINTHFGYVGTPYVDNFSSVKTLLGNLGVRYFREAPDPDYAPYVTKVQDVCNTYGMKIEGIFPADYISTGSGFNSSGVAAVLDKVKNSIGTQYYLNMEGLNEPDNWNDNDPNWPTTTRAVQQAIYTKMKADAAWANVKVLGPSAAAGDTYAALGDMKPMTDKGNLHWYASGIQPSHQEFNYFEYHYDQARLNNYSDGRPLVLSETGYTNSGGDQACSETASAKYIPRTFMYFLYSKGMEKVFTYEFINEATGAANAENNFGLVRNNLTVKPSYTSLQNTITLLKEPGANFTPGQLNYSLTGNLTDIKQVLFQKSNGKFYLVVWQEVKSFNVATQQEITVPDRALTLNLSTAIATANIYKPAPSPIGNGLTATNTYTNPTSIAINVPDHLMIIELTPGTVSGTAPTVTTTAISAITTTTASSGGNVTNGGSTSVTARGVCWSTSANPTTANSKTSDGTGTGTFTSAITGLTASTAYHVRAYATNSVGTSYGSDLTFTTSSGGGTGSLTGSVVFNTNAVNLTTVGSADWKHFRNNVHKASGTMINSISDFTVIGGTASNYTDARTMSWTGGTPTATGTNIITGKYIAGNNKGFSFTVVAGNGTNTLYFYCGGYNSAGRLTAHLSNSAAADYVNTTSTLAGDYDAVYTITYNAAQAGQTLTVSWVQTADLGSGIVDLQAAALTGTAKRPAMMATSIENPAVIIYPNPSNSYTTINFGKMLNDEKVHVEVIDLSGKIVYQSGKLSAASTLQLNTSKYAKGTYIIKITKGVETINKKLVIQ